MLGTIVRGNWEKGFCFVSPADAPRGGEHDHFAHITSCRGMTFDRSLVGRKVEFDSTKNEKGLCAVNVRPAGVTQ